MIKLRSDIILIIAICISVSGCNMEGNSLSLTSSNKEKVFSLIHSGDNVYAAKAGFQSFAKSLKYYDSAQALAEKTGDTLLLAEAIFARGRVYDAWNKEPQKTIALFIKAAELFAKIPGAYVRHLYVKHLVAHAYDKINDSINATGMLREMYSEIAPKDDSIKIKMPFTSEMALISTEVHSYALADSILTRLTKRAWIRNDTSTYDYLDHYYLTQSRLDVYYRKLKYSLYTDSLQVVAEKKSNLMDKMYYADNISRLYGDMGKFDEGYKYAVLFKQASDSLNNPLGIGVMQTALQRSELLAEQRKMEYQEAVRSNKIKVIWLLSILLGIITILSIYLQRQKSKYLHQSKQLSNTNKSLDEKVSQVELLNKEIQHRVKNNLHMIFSLLQMQERRSVNPETIENLQAARLRIESIAALHNQLLNNNGLDFTKYLQGLISSAVNCLANEKKIVTHIAADTNELSTNNYFPLSLILNEWVTNSVKYAHSKDDMIELNISIKKIEEEICVEYFDNGIRQQPQPEGLGTQIINLLCRQIKGKLTTLNDNSYHYQLCIPYGK